MTTNRTKTKKTKPQSHYLVVDMTVDEDETYPTKQYGSWSRHTSIDIHGLRVVPVGESWDVIVTGPLQPSYHLVWVRYDTGDSFGRHTGKYEIVDAFRTKAEADVVRQAIWDKDREPATRTMADYQLTVSVGGTTRTYHIPWTGYFESLTSVEWEEFPVTQE